MKGTKYVFLVQIGPVIIEIRVETGSDHLAHDQAGLTWFIKYLGLIQILHWITHVNNDVWS